MFDNFIKGFPQTEPQLSRGGDDWASWRDIQANLRQTHTSGALQGMGDSEAHGMWACTNLLLNLRFVA